MMPEILDYLSQINTATEAPYGEDEISKRLELKASEWFEKPVKIYPMSTGTIGNSLAVRAVCKSYHATLAHEYSHLFENECGAPEAFAGGRVIPVAGDDGKICPQALSMRLMRMVDKDPHNLQPRLLSLTIPNEQGVIYSLEEIATLIKIVRERGCRVHIDGARFTNALASTKLSPASLSWKLGVDVMTLGVTKCGGMSSDYLVFFDHSLAENFDFIAKQSGQVTSKMRFVSAQAIPWFDRAISFAHTANLACKKVMEAIKLLPDSVLYPTDTNMLFADISDECCDQLLANKVQFYHAPAIKTEFKNCRFVTSGFTSEEQLQNLADICHKISKAAK